MLYIHTSKCNYFVIEFWLNKYKRFVQCQHFSIQESQRGHDCRFNSTFLIAETFNSFLNFTVLWVGICPLYAL